MADRHVTTPSLGRARRHRLLVGTAMAILATTACEGSLRDQPTVRVIEEAPADGGVVAERIVDGVLVRVVIQQEDVCIWMDTPPHSADPGETGSGGCGPIDQVAAILARDGAWSAGAADDRWAVFAALVPDGYGTAHGTDGRQWEIVDNLLVLVRSATKSDRFPEEVRLAGEARPRTVEILDPRR